ncbi:hypothetical protein [Streptomyces sp. NPDC058084]|uniref:hypothetical protein n=1 Tax=Streptomyces sp. NPDC058084 TaxID=3346333 RepID=UPI0036E11A0E
MPEDAERIMDESDSYPDISRPPVLTDVARALLRRVLKAEAICADDPGFAELDRLGVLVREPYRKNVYTLAQRSHIEDQLRGAAETQMVKASQFAAGIRPFLDSIDHESAQFCGDISRSNRESYFINGVDGVHEVMSSVTYAAESEILAVQPGKRKRHLLEASAPRDIKLMQRGVVMRTIYQRVNLPVAHVRRYVARLSEVGGHFRVTDAPLIKMVMIDRSHAFIPDVAGGRTHVAGAWHVRDPGVLGYIAELFEYEWMRSAPWDEADTPIEYDDENDPDVVPETKPITTPRQRTILRGICSGHSYDQIARMLGFKGVRTIGDDMAELKAKKGFSTNEELAFWFATSPDCAVKDD